VTLGRVLGCFTDPGNQSVSVIVYLAAPGAEAASVSEEATEVRYFAPEEIPWEGLAFRTTVDAIKAWIETLPP
ncbi:MAG TPA: hypothetical protein VEU51_13925, partial [Candidatus Acidoferrales bacterium]|nr:hypothetical protein [Candidatus Acidoferrales bacterium]